MSQAENQAGKKRVIRRRRPQAIHASQIGGAYCVVGIRCLAHESPDYQGDDQHENSHIDAPQAGIKHHTADNGGKYDGDEDTGDKGDVGIAVGV